VVRRAHKPSLRKTAVRLKDRNEIIVGETLDESLEKTGKMREASEPVDKLRRSSKTLGWIEAREIGKWLDNTTKISIADKCNSKREESEYPVELMRKYGT